MLRFGLLFLVGVAGWLSRDDIPIRPSLAVAAMAVLFASLILATDYRPFGALAFGYMCLWVVVRASWLRPGPRDDLSYGVYVFHWPVEVILSGMGAAGLTQLGFTVLALTVTFVLAFASWRLIERPALSHKSRRTPVGCFPVAGLRCGNVWLCCASGACVQGLCARERRVSGFARTCRCQ